ncbi:hypothetical protein HK096_011651 [Nowakowskiella sp. JEL0078]|nr:hypothetical protein HK096_011651 [Nowakowskiella sp. JEL0078]
MAPSSIKKEKIETPNLPIPLVDTLISEPIGVLLVHERMLESFLVARDRYLKPGGTIMPSDGTIFLAPFSDANLWTQTMGKVRFWEQSNFYGVDFGPLASDAKEEIFGQPIVGNFDNRILCAPAVSHFIDFSTILIEELKDFVIWINWKFPLTDTPTNLCQSGLVHGIAGWFDFTLGGQLLSTAPSAPQTHWQQVRFMLKEPLAVNAYETVKGWMRLRVNEQRSYTIDVEITTSNNLSDPHAPQTQNETRLMDHGFTTRKGRWNLQEQTYWYTQDPPLPAIPEYQSMYEPDLLDVEILE